MTSRRLVCFAVCFASAGILQAGEPASDDGPVPEGWSAQSPRDEVKPRFRFNPAGGPKGKGSFVIAADERAGLIGYWEKTFPVQGGQDYRFFSLRRTEGIQVPRRAAVARILWQNDKGQKVLRDDPTFASYRPGQRPRAEPEFPSDGKQRKSGWTEVTGVFHAPKEATQARVELWYRWEAGGRVEWSEVSLEETEPPSPRNVRIATVHYRPKAGTEAQEKREQFAPLIAKAAEKKAELIVLPECLTYYGSGKSYAECAEPIPGPSTKYFGKLAKRHDLYLVAGLLERDNHLIYNVAVLIGPDGEVVGKYRKVTLPRGEIEGGITPGKDYPVFDTRFGKVGMMVCYDGFFPEVARRLSNRGAELIAWPVWGCNPLLAAARAAENHVFLISSTYTDVSSNWTLSAVYGRDGKVLSQASEWGSVAVADVTLGKPLHWHSLGDFRAQIPRHRPAAVAEKSSE